VLDARRQSILIAGLAGLGVGALGWLLLGSSNLGRRLDALDALTSPTSSAPRPAVAAAVQAATVARARPLFQRPVQSGAASSVRLDGVSVRGGAGRALIAVGGAAAQWLDQGDTASGVTVAQVRSGGVVIDTADGQATLTLGQTWSATTPKVSPAP
jgi:hypothetical protein